MVNVDTLFKHVMFKALHEIFAAATAKLFHFVFQSVFNPLFCLFVLHLVSFDKRRLTEDVKNATTLLLQLHVLVFSSHFLDLKLLQSFSSFLRLFHSHRAFVCRAKLNVCIAASAHVWEGERKIGKYCS